MRKVRDGMLLSFKYLKEFNGVIKILQALQEIEMINGVISRLAPTGLREVGIAMLNIDSVYFERTSSCIIHST